MANAVLPRMPSQGSRVLRIAFGCQSRAGKDTAAEYLQQRHTGGIISFAGPLKDIMDYAQQVCGFKREKDTRFLQIVGTEYARAHDPNVWLNIVKRRVNDEYKDANCYVSDLRFRNEAAMLRDEGFILIKINRGDRIIDRSQTHASENDLLNWDGWDHTIENNGTKEEFYEKIDKIINEHANTDNK